MKAALPLLLCLFVGLAVFYPATAPLKKTRRPFDLQGHRGARGLWPENSILGFVNTLKIPNVTTLEMDVVVSQDSQIVLSHEPFFSHEICLTPNGQPILKEEEEKNSLWKLPYKEIINYDCGSKPHPRFPEQKSQFVNKPTLNAVLQTVQYELNGERTIFYNIETKTKPEWDGVFTPKPDVFVRLLYQEIKDANLLNFVTIQSFDPRTLQEMRKLDPKVRLVLLVENEDGLEQNLERLGFLPQVYSPMFTLVDEKLVKAVQHKGMKIIPWTVNEPQDMKRMIGLGVDGLITDYPNRFQSEWLD